MNAMHRETGEEMKKERAESVAMKEDGEEAEVRLESGSL